MAARVLLLFPAVILAIGSGLIVACAEDSNREAFSEDGGADALSPPATDDGSVPPADAGDPDARGAFNPADESVVCDGSPCATQLVAGADHFCARMSDGTVRCWGADDFGALGGSPIVDRPDDAGTRLVGAIPDLGGVTQISAAGATTCARLDDGGVQCWGDNRYGELGRDVDPAGGDEDPHPIPRPVALGEAAVRVDVGYGSACALLASGKLSCWGRDDQKQLARGADAGSDSVIRGPGLAAVDALNFARTTAGSYTRIGLDSAGNVWSWGALAGDEGVISGRVASISPDPSPRRIVSLSQVTSFAATVSIQPPWEPPPWEPGQPLPDDKPPKPRAHACALANGEVYCWGTSYTGALCTGLPDREQEPRHAPIVAKTWPQQLAVGDEITCARMTDGTVHCCGSNTRGRLGADSSVVLSPFFQRAYAFHGHAVQVATSSAAVCALLQGGSVECWGSNERGELGRTPDLSSHPSPSKIGF